MSKSAQVHLDGPASCMPSWPITDGPLITSGVIDLEGKVSGPSTVEDIVFPFQDPKEEGMGKESE